MACELKTLDALVETIGEPDSPVYQSLLLCFIICIGTFVVSSLSKNYSQVDKLWSILPAIYSVLAVSDARTLLMAILAVGWGARLTWNFYRRGGYHWPIWEGNEDYRWEQIQAGKVLDLFKYPVPWMLFNFFFISIYQNVLLWLIATPSFVAYWASQRCDVPLNAGDLLLALLFIVLLVVESVADYQQQTFQHTKHTLKKKTGEYADGFRQSGLFAIVRKPNYAAEQAVWITFYGFSWNCVGRNYTMVGWVLLCLLFQGSGWFTEKLSLEKYPKYHQYMQKVPLYVPNVIQLFRRLKKS